MIDARSLMPTEKANLITHPVRARIMAALLGRALTTQQVGALLPDVALSSVYRHVRLLAEGGILEPVDEVRVNGTLTKVYAVRREQARIRPEDTTGATPAEHLSYFTTFLDTLAHLHRQYLEGGQPDPAADPTHALMGSLHLSPAEYREFKDALSAFLKPWTALERGGERRRVVFAHLAIPDQPDPPLS